MPKGFEKKAKRRGGVKRWRIKKLPGGEVVRIAVVRKVGPRGGHTMGYKLNPDK